MKHKTEVHIKNFQGIKDLKIRDLKQINIFLGENGVGKTRILNFIANKTYGNSSIPHLFLDGIEMGLHHSSMIKKWKYFIDLSNKNNAQIFVTTQSYEMLEKLVELITLEKKYTYIIKEDQIRCYSLYNTYSTYSKSTIKTHTERAASLYMFFKTKSFIREIEAGFEIR